MVDQIILKLSPLTTIDFQFPHQTLHTTFPHTTHNQFSTLAPHKITSLTNRPLDLEAPKRLITRNQWKNFNADMTKNNLITLEMTSSDESDEEAEQHLGVTEATGKRRDKITLLFQKFTKVTRQDTSIPTVLNFLESQPWAASTKLTAATTLISHARRKNTPIPGDAKGLIRQLKLETIHHCPNRSRPFTLKELNSKLTKATDSELTSLLATTWAFAARLTSIISLQAADISMQAFNEQYTTIIATFRSGKTILATGPYTIKTLIPTIYANFIASKRGPVWTKPPETYYNRLKPIIRPFHVRSIRRGALQALARANIEPQQILLFSRHTTVSALYRYLDDGQVAIWEQNKTEDMASVLWATATL